MIESIILCVCFFIYGKRLAVLRAKLHYAANRLVDNLSVLQRSCGGTLLSVSELIDKVTCDILYGGGVPCRPRSAIRMWQGPSVIIRPISAFPATFKCHHQ